MSYTKGNDFAPHNMISYTSPTPFVVSASSEYGALPCWKAFDGLISGLVTYWTTNTGGLVGWIKLDIGSGNSKKSYSYAVRASDPVPPQDTWVTRCPKNWTFEGSNNDSGWTVLDTRTNQTGWTHGLLREYTLDQSKMGTSYRYFKLNISANNGDSQYSEVGELYFYEALPGVNKGSMFSFQW